MPNFLFTDYSLVSCYIINYRLSYYRSHCQGYRTHRPAEEQDPSAGDPRCEVPPRGGQNCGHEERQDHRGRNLPSALGPGQGVRGFSHPVHTGKNIEQENEEFNSFCYRQHMPLTEACSSFLLIIQHPDTSWFGYVGKCWRFYVCSMD